MKKMLRTSCILLFFVTVLNASLKAQTGPGGVGNAAGSAGQPANRLWLRGDAGTSTTVNGATVATWDDQSGNANNTSSAASPTAPLYQAGVANGKPVLRFDGNQFFRASAVGIAGNGGSHYFIVPKANGVQPEGTTTAAGGAYLIDRFPGGNPLASLKIIDAPSQRYGYQKRTDAGGGLTSISSTTAISQTNFQIVNYTRIRIGANNSVYRIFVNGNAEGTQVDNADGDLTPDAPQIGRHAINASEGLNGDIAEVLVYGAALNAAQRIIVENYLSAKYAVPVSNDKFSSDALYPNDLAGIGRESIIASHVSANSSILNFNVAAIGTNAHYLLFGHDNANAAALTNITGDDFRADASGTRRVAREWRVDRTGGFTDNVDVAVDVSAITGLPANFTYALFIDANGDGDFVDASDTFADLTGSGATRTAADVAIPDGATVTIGALQRVLAFASATSQGFENTVPFPPLTVAVNYPYTAGSTDITFAYSVVPTGANPATDPADFTTTRATGTLVAGNATADLNAGATTPDAAIAVVNDGGVENTEQILLTLASPTGAILGTQLTQVYSILDDDDPRKISFSTAAFSVSEGNGGGTQLISVTLNIAQPTSGSAPFSTVEYAVSGTATIGNLAVTTNDARINETGTGPITDTRNERLSETQGRITFDDAITTVTLNLLVSRQDDGFESDETIVLTLQNPASAALSVSDPVVLTITLTDDDGAPTVQFATANSSFSETVGTVNVGVTLSAAAGVDVTVDFSVAGGTPPATGGGVDYTAFTVSPVTIPAGSTSASVQIGLINDVDEEPDEQVLLTITGTSAALGTPLTHTLTILDNDLFGDVGPGGVGQSTSNALWVKADAGTSTTTDGAALTFWNDQSGNVYNLNSVFGTPLYRAGFVNGQPAIAFNGDQFFTRNAAFGIAGDAGFHYFVVAQANGAQGTGGFGDGNGAYLIDRNTVGFSDQPLAGLKVLGGQLYGFQKRDDAGGGLGGVASTSPISTAAFQIVDYARVRAANAYQIFVNAVNEGTLTATDGDITPSPIHIGRHASTANGGLNGWISEVAVYDNSLNAARRIIVENYLSAKYSTAIINDFYAGDAPLNGNYDFEVQGIGTTDGTFTNGHISASNGGGLSLRERNGSLDAAGEFLLSGHNGLAAAPLSQSDLALPVTDRWQRVWFLDKSGAIDARTIFDFSSAGVSVTPASPANYRLLYRAGQSGAFAEVATAGAATIENTDQIVFDVDNINLIDGYYTIGTTNLADSPLPVELTLFNISLKDGGVLAQWTTASETNNAGFILERSETRSGGYEEVASYRTSDALKGLGNSATGKNYQVTDAAKLDAGKTYFYKLKDVSLSGTVTEYEPKSVVALQYALDQNYPNPFNPTTTIRYALRKDGQTTLTIYNVLGQKVAVPVDENQKAGSYQLAFNAARLSSGLYFYRLQSGTFTATKKMLIVK
ncbi:MAG: T9SS type A sorting domain-containing protein [Rhizobacter sp.]|nr:T9SS type A sorting domain-containing protein [Chlorobiales bacterium]